MKLEAKAIAALHASVQPVATFFQKGLSRYFDPATFQKALDKWVDGHLHGGVPVGSRVGYALRQDDLGHLQPGLLLPAYQRLCASDLPESEGELRKFLTKLVVNNVRPQYERDVDRALSVTTSSLAGPDGIRSIDTHAAALWALRASHPALFETVVLGNFAAAGTQLAMVADDRSAEHLVRTVARQRLIWNLFDVHRVAAHGQNYAAKIVPGFMAPFIRSGNIRPIFQLMIEVGGSILRYSRNAEAAEVAGHPDRVRVYGADSRRAVIRPAAEMIEVGLNQKYRDDVVAARALIADQTNDLVKRAGKGLEATDTSRQMSIHEWFYEVSDIGGLFMTANAAADEEARLIEIIANPDSADDLFRLELRLAPTNLKLRYHTRALHLVYAYRGAVMTCNRAGEYDARNVFTGDRAVECAVKIIRYIRDGNALTKAQSATKELYSLSHTARFK